MALRRGFKSEAERIAEGVRADLGLSAAQPVTPRALADLLGVEIRAGDELIPRSRFEALEELQPDAFSACTFRPSEERAVVVFNPLSANSRRSSDLAHELSHVLLDHELSRIETLGEITFLSCDAIQEEEAGWLSGCLLLPRPLLLAAVRRGLTAGEVAEEYHVSETMARFRLNVTGVLRQAAKSRATARPRRRSGRE